MTLAQLLHEHRRASHKSIRALGVELGVSAAYLSEIEGGRKQPGPEVLGKICKHIGIDSSQIDERETRVIGISAAFRPDGQLFIFALRSDGKVKVNRFSDEATFGGELLSV